MKNSRTNIDEIDTRFHTYVVFLMVPVLAVIIYEFTNQTICVYFMNKLLSTIIKNLCTCKLQLCETINVFMVQLIIRCQAGFYVICLPLLREV